MSSMIFGSIGRCCSAYALISECSQIKLITRGIPSEYRCTASIALALKIDPPLAPPMRSLSAQHDSLPQLPQFRQFQLFFELRLAGKHDLEQFFRGGLQIG